MFKYINIEIYKLIILVKNLNIINNYYKVFFFNNLIYINYYKNFL